MPDETPRSGRGSKCRRHYPLWSSRASFASKACATYSTTPTCSYLSAWLSGSGVENRPRLYSLRTLVNVDSEVRLSSCVSYGFLTGTMLSLLDGLSQPVGSSGTSFGNTRRDPQPRLANRRTTLLFQLARWYKWQVSGCRDRVVVTISQMS